MTFGAFSKMVSNLPPEAIIGAMDRECQTLEDDLEHDRLTDDDAISILCFKQFIQMARRREVIRCAKRLPPDHLEFYRVTLVRLVQANELRASVMEQFERAFSLIP
jgi:hypothetical protein